MENKAQWANGTQWINYETVTGEPIAVRELTLRPISRLLTIRWTNGAWIWNRPIGIEIEENGAVHQVSIVDITRQGQWLLLGLALLFVIIGIFRH